MPGKAGRHGVSFIERILLHEIGCFLPVEKSSVNRIELGNGKSKNVDIISRELRLIVEYDGNVWHEKTIEKDKLETGLLEKQGWTVIRIREAPLLPLNPNLDLAIPSHGLTYHEKSCKVLSHLDCLGLIPKDQKNPLSTYIEKGSLLIPPEHMQSASLDEVNVWAKSKGLNTPKQWAAATAQTDFPIRFPKSPKGFYGRRGEWKGWPDFFNRPAIQEPRKRKSA